MTESAKAVTVQQRTRGLLEERKDEFARALAGRVDPDAFVRVAYATITKQPKLLEATPASLLMALLECANLGLQPNSVMGEAFLVPFNNKVGPKGKETWEVHAQFIPGFRGLAKLARQSGHVTKIIGRVVREGDRFEVVQGTDERLEHVPALSGNQRPIVAVYAVVFLKEGPPVFDVMEKWEVDRIRARSKSKDNGPWVSDYDEMAKKTVFRRLAKYLPFSDTDIDRALEADNRDYDMSASVRDAGPVSDLNDALGGEEEEFTGEVVPDPPAAEAKPQKSREERMTDQILALAAQIDEQRKRTGVDLDRRPALSDATDFVNDANATSATLERHGKKLRDRLKELQAMPDGQPPLDYAGTQPVPTLDEANAALGELPFDGAGQ